MPERKIYKIACPALAEHNTDWIDIPRDLQDRPLLAPGKPGPNPELVRSLQRCPSCIVRVMYSR